MPTPTEEIERQAQLLHSKIQDAYGKHDGLYTLLTEGLKDISQDNTTDQNLNDALYVISSSHKMLEIFVFVLTLILTLFFIAIALISLAAVWYQIANYVPFVGTGAVVIGSLNSFFKNVGNLFIKIKEQKLLTP